MSFTETYPRGVDAKIRETTPGYAEACQAVERLEEIRLPVLSNHQLASLEVAEQLHARALESDVDASVLLELADDVRRKLDALTLANEGLREAQQRAKAHRDSLVSTSTLMAGYGDALNVLLTDLDELAPVEEILTPGAAIASGRVDDHQRLLPLLEAYRDLRAKHFRILDNSTIVEYAEAAVFPDACAAFPLWAPWRSHGYLVDRRPGNDSTKTIRPPWPNDRDSDTRREFRRVAASAEFLVWAHGAGVTLWMPDAEDFEAAQNALRSARSRTARERANDAARTTGDAYWVDPVLKPVARGRLQ